MLNIIINERIYIAKKKLARLNKLIKLTELKKQI